MKIVSIDSERFFGKELSEQNLVVLFKRPLNANDTICESYCQDIVNVIKDYGENLYASDIVGYCEWKPDVCDAIVTTLYVRKGINNPTTAADIYSEPHGIYDVVSYDDKEIAKIRLDKQTTVRKNYIFLLVVLMLFLGGLVRWCVNKVEKDRMLFNQAAYTSDSCAIDSLAVFLNESTSPPYSYVSYISAPQMNAINYTIDSLRKKAKHNFLNVKDDGVYSPVGLDRKVIIAAISDLVKEAKLLESETLERNRKKENKEAFDKDMLTIGSLCDLLYREISGSVSCTDRQVVNIERTLDSLEKVAEASFKEVEHAGQYKQVCTDSDLIKNRIHDIVDNAQKGSKNKLKDKNTQKALKNPVKTTIVRSSTQKIKIDDNRFTQLVRSADTDCVKYYTTGDEVAGRNARNNYKKALNIKYDSNIYSKWKKLNDIFR